MGTSLNGTTPQNTYPSLIKVTDNTALSATAKYLSDGQGNDSALSLSTDKVGIGTNTPFEMMQIGSPTNRGTLNIVNDGVTPSIRMSGLNSGNNQSIIIGDGNGALDFQYNGTTTLYLDYQNNVSINTARLALGAKLGVRGSGTTSATTSFLVQNSSGFNAIQVTDDLKVNINTLVFGGSNGYIGINNSPNIDSALRAVRTDGGTSPLSISTGEIGVGDTTTYASAIFAIGSTTRGFLCPRMTTTQKNAIATPASGLQVYDTTLNQMSYYNGTTWVNI